jgi:Tfp pilus assembly protein PilO
MKEFIKKYKVIVAIAAYVVLIAGLFYFVVGRIVTKIQGVGDQIVQQDLAAQSKQQQVNEIPKMQQQFDEISSKNDVLSNMFLNKNDAVKLIEQVEDLAKQCQVSVDISVQDNQVAPKPQAPATPGASPTVVGSLPGSNYLKFTFNLKGSYNNIVEFMSRLENMQYYADIISMDIKQNTEIDTTSPPASGSGVLNPFANSPTSKTQTANTPPKGGYISAALDVVFYLQ